SRVMADRSRSPARRGLARRSSSACRSRTEVPEVTLLSDIVETSAAVTGTSARLEKIARLADTLRRLDPDEASIGVAYLSNQRRQRQTGVGYASMRDLPAPAREATLTLSQVDAALDVIGRLSGKDSQAGRRRQLP